MRYIRLFCTILLLFSLTNEKVVALAMNTGFSTEVLSQDDIDTFLKNINISMLAEEPSKKPIECFDVNESGVIAIGCSDYGNKTVCIYTSDGDFQYGYSFECSGDFGVEWDEENLNIYFVRSSVIVSVTPIGEVLDVFEVKNTIENNSYVNQFMHATKRTIGNEEYYIRNNMGLLNLFASSYSQIIVKDSNGAESIIYDVGSMQFSHMIVTISAVCIFVFVAITAIARQFIKLRRGN